MHDAESVIREHGPMVWRLALANLRSAADAEDVFQDVFMRYVQHADELTSDEHRKAWLIRVTINRCRSLQRQWLRRKHMPLTEEPAVAFESPEESAVDEAMERLPQKYRTVIHLHYYEGYTTDDIARITQQRPSAVRTQLTRARRLLGGLLKGDEANV